MDYLTALGAFTALFGLIITIRQFRQQLRLNFFADYTRRYQEIIINFPEQINESNFRISDLSPEVRDRTMRYMRAYFDLCSEEYYLKREGHIDDSIWKEWKAGIQYAFTKPAFQQAWDILSQDTIYYGKFTSYVEDSILNRRS